MTKAMSIPAAWDREQEIVHNPTEADCGQRQSPAGRAEVHSAVTAKSIVETTEARA